MHSYKTHTTVTKCIHTQGPNENVTSTHFRSTTEYSNTDQILCLHNRKKYHCFYSQGLLINLEVGRRCVLRITHMI